MPLMKTFGHLEHENFATVNPFLFYSSIYSYTHHLHFPVKAFVITRRFRINEERRGVWSS